MCGFISVFQDREAVDLTTARRALDSMSHRGPDKSADWWEEGVYLGHRRLSIIDLATGDQPMFTRDGRYGVVFNGEIYNFPELRSELSREGSFFDTQSDTEVILEGYRRWGVGVVERLNGMFAFTIWDRDRKSVFGARDRLGIKPLCWSIREGALMVGSTLEPFLALGHYGALNPVAIRDLMAFDYISSPRTILEDVHKLEPGCRFEWSFGCEQLKIEKYWSPPRGCQDLAPPSEDELESLLERAVERQMISDVPIGAFLSGGIDSSILVAMMSRHSTRPVRTFSVSFEGHDVDESDIATLVAERFETDHTVIEAREVGPEDLLRLVGSLDEPFCDPAYIPTFSLSEMTRQHVKVALSGDGGDEVFGGYPKYLLGAQDMQSAPMFSLVDRALRATPWRPRGMGRLYWRLLSREERIRFAYTSYGDFPVFRKDMRQLLVADYRERARVSEFFDPWESRIPEPDGKFGMEVLMRTDLRTYLSENCLVKTDRASMLASLEVRVPYLDEMVLDRILPLSADRKIVNGQLKALLLPLARRLLPRVVWDRPKHGFTVPLEHHLAHEWRPAVEAALDWGQSNFRVFDYGYLRRLHAINIGSASIGRELWNPFVLIAWSMARGVTV